MEKTEKKEEAVPMKILSHGKKSNGFVYLSAVIMLTGICFVLFGVNSLVKARYNLLLKQSEQFYNSIEKNNLLVMEEK